MFPTGRQGLAVGHKQCWAYGEKMTLSISRHTAPPGWQLKGRNVDRGKGAELPDHLPEEILIVWDLGKGWCWICEWMEVTIPNAADVARTSV